MAGAKFLALLALVAFVFVALVPGTVVAWGADGHHSTCLLAESMLEPATVKAVRSLLPEYANGSLASLCTWPDDIKWMYKWHWTHAIHYIDTPDFLCRYNYDRDCHDADGRQDYCASGAINNYTSQLTKFELPPPNLITTKVRETQYNLTEALLFLAHIVGDIHQPLHVGFTNDAGGNTIILHWYRRKANLHHVWDNEFINRAKDLYYNGSLAIMTTAILNNITDNWVGEAKLWSECSDGAIACPDVYATESIRLACQYAYRNATPGSTLGDDYFLSRLPIVEARLAQGGVRLAAILNRLFGNSSQPILSH